MWVRAVLLLVLAGGVGYGTIQLAQQWLANERAQRVAAPAAPATPPSQPDPSTFVLVAADDLAIGRFIGLDDLRWQGWPDDSVPDSYVVRGEADPAAFAGAVTRSSVAAGQPIIAGQLVRPGERGFLAAVLGPGMRAVTIPINDRTGIAGFVHPGDRVDIILTHRFRIVGDLLFEGLTDISEERTVSETVLRDMRVLAIDQILDDMGQGAQLARLVTLEVTPRQAEIINVMLDIGSLSLSLRSLADPQQPEIAGTLASLGIDIGLASQSEADPYVGAAALLEPANGRTITYDSDVSLVVPSLEDLLLPGLDEPAEPVKDDGDPAPIPDAAEYEVTIFRGSASPTARN